MTKLNRKAVERFMDNLPVPKGWGYVLIMHSYDESADKTVVQVLGNGDREVGKILVTELAKTMAEDEPTVQ